MRLQCDVEVRNRCLPSLNLSKNNRPSSCRVVLLKRSENVVSLVISTKKDPVAYSYKINDNIEAVFSKFARMGKCTLRFIQPTDDVSISNASPMMLRHFLYHLQQVLSGKDLEGVTTSTVAPYKGAKKNMTISSRRELLTAAVLPRTLQTLIMSHCEMTRLDVRVLTLNQLRTLSLAHNSLTALPESLTGLYALVDLDLSHNQLTDFPPALLKAPIAGNLRCLNLSHNQISKLPKGFEAMTDLFCLRLNGCGLQQLPESLGKLAGSLRVLDVAENALTSLPFSIIHLRLSSIDISGNPLMPPCVEELTALPAPFPVPSLMELSARVVLDAKLEVSSEEMPKILIDYLKTAKLCYCGGHCIEASRKVYCTVRLSALAATHTHLLGQSDTCLLETEVCSLRCHWNFYRARISRNPRC